jgi:hypothetical protein
MIRLQTTLAALAALLMALSVVLTGSAAVQSLHNKAQHTLPGVMDDALIGPERPVWTRTQVEHRDGDTLDMATAAQPEVEAGGALAGSAPVARIGRPLELIVLSLARGPPATGT